MADLAGKYPPPVSSTLYPNNGPPKYIVGNSYCPPGYNGKTGATVTTTANRCYYFPLPIWEDHTFAGAQVFNSGAGDNGEKIRLMVFNDDLTTGGPGTLAKDFGEITLTGASALRTLASTWAARRGMYWGAAWHDSASAMAAMETSSFRSDVGVFSNPVASLIGYITPSAAANLFVNGMYVDTAYGAAPASAVAPTTTLYNDGSANSGTLPVFWLKG